MRLFLDPIPHQENLYKGQLVKCLREGQPGHVIFAHQDVRSPGVPDISDTSEITWWIECKHACPDFAKNELQELSLRRLAHKGHAIYVIWHESHDGGKQTLILRPEEVFGKGGKTSLMVPETSCVGFNHRFVLAYLRNTRG